MKEVESKPDRTETPKPFERRVCGPRPARQPQGEEVEDQLDEALDESFPASDPPSIASPKP